RVSHSRSPEMTRQAGDVQGRVTLAASRVLSFLHPTIQGESVNVRIRQVACALAYAFIAVGIGSANAADIKDRNFKVGMANAAGTAQYDGAVRFAELLNKKSGGKMKAKLFGNSSLGKDTAVVSAMQGGTIEMGIMN